MSISVATINDPGRAPHPGADHPVLLSGNDLSNTLRGGAGDDNLDGRAGADALDCGPDWDWFNHDPQDLSVINCENPWRWMPFGS